MHEYNAKLVKVVDGDTLDAMIDLGFSVWVKKRIRFVGINTPESRTRDLEEKKRGLAAKEKVKDEISKNGNEFIVKSQGTGKYGRCLGIIMLKQFEHSLNDEMIKSGHAVEYYGGKRG